MSEHQIPAHLFLYTFIFVHDFYKSFQRRILLICHKNLPTLVHLLLLKINHISRAKAGKKTTKTEQVRKRESFAIALHNSALHWKPWDISCHTGSNIYMDIHILTDEKVSRKTATFCLHVWMYRVTGALRPRQTSFIHPTPPPGSTQTMSQPLSYEGTVTLLCVYNT